MFPPGFVVLYGQANPVRPLDYELCHPYLLYVSHLYIIMPKRVSPFRLQDMPLYYVSLFMR